MGRIYVWLPQHGTYIRMTTPTGDVCTYDYPNRWRMYIWLPQQVTYIHMTTPTGDVYTYDYPNRWRIYVWLPQQVIHSVINWTMSLSVWPLWAWSDLPQFHQPAFIWQVISSQNGTKEMQPESGHVKCQGSDTINVCCQGRNIILSTVGVDFLPISLVLTLHEVPQAYAWCLVPDPTCLFRIHCAKSC